MSQTLIRQVAANCELASSLQAGSFSLCGLLLRLRLLYKWQHDLPPWREPEPKAVLAWIADLENAWETQEGEPFHNLQVNGATLDPFEVERINAFLEPEGLAYGAGFGRGLAPTFVLAELAEVRREDELTIMVLEEELVRDLAAHPAMCQGNLIYARGQSLAYYLWDRLADPTQQGNRFLRAGWQVREATLPALLKNPEHHRELWEYLVAEELEAVIRHELGEARETSLDQAYSGIVALFPQTPLDYWIRAVKDALADLNEVGRLSYIISGRRLTSLALMLAFQPGFYPLLLPELEPAFWKVAASGDWEIMDTARRTALDRLRRTAQEVMELWGKYGEGPQDQLKDVLTARFLTPLGL
ncbi:MAG: Sfum_1244 family protein [Desulfobaccales bacterium]